MTPPDRRGVEQMKLTALGLLAFAALLYVAATALRSRHPAWGYVAAFGEAAVIGAMADWFAVVALFRRPMGLPIPHTAIIPSNKSRIGRELADFICSHFLGTAQVLEKIERFDAAGRLAGWLAEPRHAAQVGRHFAGAVRYGLGALEDDRVRGFVRNTVIDRLHAVDVPMLAGRVFELLTASRRHQALLDQLLRQFAKLLEDEVVQAKIAEIIADDLGVLRYLGLSRVAGKLATERLVAGVGRLIGEMGADEAHPLRLRFDAYAADFVERLKRDPALRARLRRVQRDVLDHPALGAYVQQLWSDFLGWLRRDLEKDASVIRRRVAEAARTLGAQLHADAAMRGWINRQLLDAAPLWIDRYREDIRRYIAARVDEWDAHEMTEELERSIGRDLQFVRINGTLVGGLIGLAIYAATRWLA